MSAPTPNSIVCGSALEVLKTWPGAFIHTVVTSPPYWGLRDYGVSGQLGLERTPQEYVEKMVAVFREVRRVLRDNGTLWINLGSSYASGDISPSQSPADARPCGICGRERKGSLSADPACSDSDGGHLDEKQIHHDRTSRIDQSDAQVQQRNEQKAHGNGQTDFDATFSGASPHDVQESTKSSSFRRGRAACVPSAKVSDDHPRTRSSSGDVPQCECKAGNKNGNEWHESDDRISGKDVSGMAWLNYTKFKHKDLVPIPWMVAMALQADGWYLRQDIIWSKPNPMPESVTDRCTKAHEYMFLLSKSERYYYDQDEIAEEVTTPTIERMGQGLEAQAGSDRVPGKTNGTMKAVLKSSGNKARKAASARGVPVDDGGDPNGAGDGSVPWEGSTRNKRSVWAVTTKPCKEAHFATFPPDLIAPCVLAGSPRGGLVLDPFMGAGTTALVAAKYDRRFLGIELNPKYIEIAERRIAAEKAQGKLPL